MSNKSWSSVSLLCCIWHQYTNIEYVVKDYLPNGPRCDERRIRIVKSKGVTSHARPIQLQILSWIATNIAITISVKSMWFYLYHISHPANEFPLNVTTRCKMPSLASATRGQSSLIKNKKLPNKPEVEKKSFIWPKQASKKKIDLQPDPTTTDFHCNSFYLDWPNTRMRFVGLLTSVCWSEPRSHGAVVDVDGPVLAGRDDLGARVVVLNAPYLGIRPLMSTQIMMMMMEHQGYVCVHLCVVIFPSRSTNSSSGDVCPGWRRAHLVLMVEESIDTHSGVCVPNLHALIRRAAHKTRDIHTLRCTDTQVTYKLCMSWHY